MNNQSTIVSENDFTKFRMKERSLFLAGILGPIVYIINVVLGGIITPNYSHIQNAVLKMVIESLQSFEK